MFNDFTSSSSLNYIDPFQIVIDSITMDNPTADVSFIFENSGIIKEVKARKQTLAMIDFIRNKQPTWENYKLRLLASLYYLAEKYIIDDLKSEIIKSIPGNKALNDGILNIGILAQDNISQQQLSDALFDFAARLCKEAFKRKLKDKLVHLTNKNEKQSLVTFKIMKRTNEQSFGKIKLDLVFGLIWHSEEYLGTSRNFIYRQLDKNMSEREVDDALDWLGEKTGEAHIYSTIDDHHFRPTDRDWRSSHLLEY